MEDLKTGLFDYINDLTSGKKGLADKDDQFEKNYNPFMVSRGLSYNVDCVLWANAINEYHSSVTKRMHYDFFFGVLKKSKRYGKWHKEINVDIVALIAEYYKINLTEAESMMDLIPDDQLERIKLAKGGKIK